MIAFENLKEFKFDKLDEIDSTISTLLIPEQIVEKFLEKRMKFHGNNTRAYLKNLLSRYRFFTHSGMLPIPRKIKTEYQEKNQNLKRISFRPCNTDWIELGELALAFGKSRCWIFTYLLSLDFAEFWSNLQEAFRDELVPTFSNLELRISWSVDRFFHSYSRAYYVKV